MARPPSVWQRKEDGWFYTTIKGQQIKLAAEKKESTRLFHELLAKHEEPAGTNISPMFSRMAELFLDESERTKAPTTYRTIRYGLQSFCDWIGNKRVADVRVHHVTTWVAEHQRPSKPGEMTSNGTVNGKVRKKARVPWNDSTACTHRTNLLACLNWAVAQGYLDSHPLKKLKRGRHARRERIFNADEMTQIKATVKPDFRDFLEALELTGARPFSELATLTADKINWQTMTIPLSEHKNKNKGKTRTIYISPPLAALLKRKCAEYPTGPLFRNRWGTAWRSHDATRRLRWATDKLGIPRGTVYGVRHQFCTAALGKGINMNVLAELVGNSPITLSRYYDHLSKQPQTMLDAAARAVG